MEMTELCGKPSSVVHESTVNGKSTANKGSVTVSASQRRIMWIRRFNLAVGYALAVTGKRFLKIG